MNNRCMHCGREMKRRHVNFRTGEWECRESGTTLPGCYEGRKWFAERTYVKDGIRRMNDDREVE